MLPAEQRDLVRDHVGPAFRAAGLETRILLFDHNLDRIDHPLTSLVDPKAASFVDGTAFHHYGGDFTAMGLLHEARPDKNLYFTEQMVVVVPNVAFLRPDGRIAMIVANDGAAARRVVVQHRGRYAAVRLDAGAVATLVW